MHLWVDNLAYRPQHAATYRIMGKLTALLLTLCLLPAAIADTKETEQPPAARSTVQLKGFPSPVVPPSPRADDSYFTDVVLIGDSLASGIPHYKVMPALEVTYKIGLSPIEMAGNKEVIRFKGKNPMTLPEYLASRNPRAIYLWVGLNDIECNPASKILPFYDRMLNHLIEALPDTPIFLLEVTPVTKDAVKRRSHLTNENVNDFNAGLFELARTHNIYLLQIHDGLTDANGILPKKFAANDGFHLSRAGYNEVIDYLYTHTLPIEPAKQ